LAVEKDGAGPGTGAGTKAQYLRLTAVLVLFAIVAAASRGLGMASLPGPMGPTGEAETLEALLCSAAANVQRGAEIQGLARSLGEVARAEGLDVKAAFVQAFPPSEALLPMLALDRDVEDFETAGQGTSLAAAHYRRAAQDAEVLRPLRGNYARLFAAAYGELAAPPSAGDRAEERLASFSSKPNLARLASDDELDPPPLRDLDYSHPYALDIFFTKVDTRGAAEEGPEIHAVEAGIVVAAAGDWRGGAGAETWEGGGLSPSSGNGVVIFSPATGRYYSYFHFSEVALHRGDVVSEGGVLGRGGNTGANARRKGHGGHLHLEIYDALRERALSAWQIRDLLY
jgi:murein DD-endopeptidase MepM/ murein hydrolase activator NlpD